MIGVPAHKQTDPAKTAGQIKTLGDYIQQKTANDPKKLTFEDWWRLHLAAAGGATYQQFQIAQSAWNASRANL